MPAASNTGWPTANPEQDESGGTFTGAALEVLAGKIDRMAEAAARPASPRIPWEACHPVWFTGQIPLTAGAGTLQQPNLYGPELPYWWDLRSVRLWGFTAGTVTVFRNLGTPSEILAQVTTIGELTWSAQEFIGPQDTLVFTGSGITGSVNVTGWAIEVQAAWLPEYLM